jgi:hypothetical protein
MTSEMKDLRDVRDDCCPKCGHSINKSLQALCRLGEAQEASEARAEAAEARLFKVLVTLYRESPLTVANLCDDHLDRSGALLGRVREATLSDTEQETGNGQA